jgi:hypothetical protein
MTTFGMDDDTTSGWETEQTEAEAEGDGEGTEGNQGAAQGEAEIEGEFIVVQRYARHWLFYSTMALTRLEQKK